MSFLLLSGALYARGRSAVAQHADPLRSIAPNVRYTVSLALVIEMYELCEAVPDPQVVLALEPEELGAKLLFLLRMRFDRDGKPFSPHNCLGEIRTGGDRTRGQIGYPQEFLDEITSAVAEAFAWLQGQGLIVASQGQASWYTLSRRAKKFESKEDFFRYSLARMLPQQALHPVL